MSEHVFFCGLSEEQRSEYSAGKILSLETKAGNLKLKLDRMRKRLVGAEPERLTDFVEIASYVFAADRNTSRGPLWDPGFGGEWRRDFLLVVAVRDLAFWQQQDVKETLQETLGFLSEDWWRFEFVENCHPVQLQQYLGLKEDEADVSGGTSVVLFSGGLDSLAGAIHELNHSNRHVVLVSHRNLPKVGQRQANLAERLGAAYTGRVSHVWVDNSLTSKLQDREETQRTRSFFFTAMAAVAAHIEKSDRIRFYENGVMSVNLPLATQAVGAKSSRSTHPRSLQLLERLLNLIAKQPIDIDNPFVWKTKSEVIGELAGTPHASMITITTSCTNSRIANRTYRHHCGVCVQCLQRRISTLGGGAGDLDEEDCYEVDFLIGPRDDGLDRVMAVESVNLALDCADISEQHFIGRFSEALSRVLQSYPSSKRDDTAKKLIGLYRRHGVIVRAILDEAKVTDVLDRTLPPSSLLALVLASRLSGVSQSVFETPPKKLPEPLPGSEAKAAPVDDRLIAIDKARHSILISDRPELRGHAIYPIMKLLIEAAEKDRADGLLPRNHRSFQAKLVANQLANQAAGSVTAAIKRAREDFSEADIALDGAVSDPNAIIETVQRKGYRLNPNVRVVTPEEFKSR